MQKGRHILLCLLLFWMPILNTLGQTNEKEFTTIIYRGRITDQSGKGIPEAQVDVYDEVDLEQIPSILRHRITLITQEDGYYGFEREIRPGRRWCNILLASAEGYAFGWTVSMTDQPKIPTIELMRETGSLSGTVIDSQGQAVENAIIHMFGRYGTNKSTTIAIGSTQPFMAQTGPDGRFLFEQLPANIEAEFCIEKEGYRRQFSFRTDQNLRQYRYHAGQQDISLPLYRNGSLKGQLYFKESAEPITNEEVYVVRIQGEDTRLGTYSIGSGFAISPTIGGLDNCVAVTDEMGHFEVPNLLAGKYTVFIDQSTTSERGWYVQKERINITEDQTETVSLEVIQGGRLRVQLIDDSVESRPIEGARVQISADPEDTHIKDYISKSIFSQTTDSQGQTAFQLPPGKYRLTGIGKNSYWENRTEEVIEIIGGQTRSVRFSFEPKSGVPGIVLDSDGKPLEGVEIFILPSKQKVIVSDKQGRFLLPEDILSEEPVSLSADEKKRQEMSITLFKQGVHPGDIDYMLRDLPIPKPHDRFLVAQHEKCNLLFIQQYRQGSRIKGPLQLQLHQATMVSGQILDNEERIIANAIAQVELVDRLNYEKIQYLTWKELHTDVDGRFLFPVVTLENPEISYLVTIIADGFGKRRTLLTNYPDTSPSQITPQIKLLQGTIDLGTFILSSDYYTVTGVIVDKYGRPLQNILVSFESGEQPSQETIRTGENGRFSFSDLRSGTIRIRAFVDEQGSSVTIKAGTQNVRIVLVMDEFTEDLIGTGFAGGSACEIRFIDSVTKERITDKEAKVTIHQENGNTIYLPVESDGVARICLGPGTHEISTNTKNYTYKKHRITVENKMVYTFDLKVQPTAAFEEQRSFGDVTTPSILQDGQWTKQPLARSMGNLHISVKDQKTEMPITGATVIVSFKDGNGRYEAIVNEKGYANVAILETGVFTIESIHAQEFEELQPKRILQLRTTSNQSITYTLKPIPVYITVSVLDDKGQPVPKAYVRHTYLINAKWKAVKQAQTDDKGQVKLEWIAESPDQEPRVDHFLQVKSSIHNGGILYAEIVRARQNEIITLIQMPRVMVRGRIIDSQGNPIPKKNLNILCVDTGWTMDYGYDQTDTNGVFEIAPIPLGLEYKVVCDHEAERYEWPFSISDMGQEYFELGDLVIQ